MTDTVELAERARLRAALADMTVESVALADGDPFERDPLDRAIERRIADDRRGPADRRISGTDRRIAYAVDSIGRGTDGAHWQDGTERDAYRNFDPELYTDPAFAEHESDLAAAPWRVQDTQAYAMLDADGRAAVDAIARGNEADESPADRFVRYVRDYAAGWIGRDTYSREAAQFVENPHPRDDERGEASVAAIITISAILTLAAIGAILVRTVLEAAAAALPV